MHKKVNTLSNKYTKLQPSLTVGLVDQKQNLTRSLIKSLTGAGCNLRYYDKLGALAIKQTYHKCRDQDWFQFSVPD